METRKNSVSKQKLTINISEYPQNIIIQSQESVFTIGNVHGNAGLILHTLILSGAISIDKKDYDELIKIYEKSNQSYSNKDEDIFKFLKLLDRIKPGIVKSKMRFLGNDLASSGNHDFLTLMLYNKLSELKIDYEVIASNHNIQFLKQYAYGLDKEVIMNLDNVSAASFYAIKKDVEENILSIHDLKYFDEIIEAKYLPNNKLLSYMVIDENKIVLFSHAPLNTKRILALAKSFDISADISDINGMTKTINEINNSFSLIINNKSSLESIQNNTALMDFISGDAKVFDEENEILAYQIMNICGSIGNEESHQILNINNPWEYLNLDSSVGKSGITGECAIVISEENKFVLKNIEQIYENQQTKSIIEDISSDDESAQEIDVNTLEFDDNKTQFLYRHGDLNNYPIEIFTHSIDEILTIHDLHGNALKLIYILITEGIIKISSDDYQTLRKIYVKSDTIYEGKYEDFETFISIVRSGITEKEIESSPTIRILGDDFSDRGKNDRLMSIVYHICIGLGIRIEIITSNHGMEFLRQFTHGLKNDYVVIFNGPDFYTSLIGLVEDTKNNIFNESDIYLMLEKYYLPNLKVLSYEVCDDMIILFSHAPINMLRIRRLAENLSIAPLTDTIENLTNTIDEINATLSEIFCNRESLIKFFKEEYNKILVEFVWARGEVAVEDDEICDFKVMNFHGHVAHESIDNNNAKNQWIYINLDNPFGRPGYDVWDYVICSSTSTPIINYLPVEEKAVEEDQSIISDVIEVNEDKSHITNVNEDKAILSNIVEDNNDKSIVVNDIESDMKKYHDRFNELFKDPNHKHSRNQTFLSEIKSIMKEDTDSKTKMALLIEKIEFEINKEKIDYNKVNPYNPTLYDNKKVPFDTAIVDPNHKCEKMKRAKLFYGLLQEIGVSYGELYADVTKCEIGVRCFG